FAEEICETNRGGGDDQLVPEVCEIVGSDSEVAGGEVGIPIPLRQPSFGAQTIRRRDRFAQFVNIAALILFDLRWIKHRRLAPWLPAGRRIDRALHDRII